MTTVRLWWLLRRHESATTRLPGLLAVTAFAVATGSLLVALGGVLAFRARVAPGADPVHDPAYLYVVLAYIAAGLMAVPILTLGGLAARLTVARRNARLANLRLAGATSGQTLAMTLLESASQALLGGVAGIGLYAASLPLLARIPFDGKPFGVAPLWVGWGIGLLVVLGVVGLAVVSGAVSMAAVVVTPLGVSARTTPAKLSALRLLVFVVVLIGWVVASRGVFGGGIAVVIGFLVAMVAAINVIGPWVMMLFGRAVAATASTPERLLAGRRIVDDPRSAWRASSTMGLTVMLAALAAVTSVIPDGEGDYPYVGTDMRMGALITLAIVGLVAATSAGVVHASRVIDQRLEYRALALAGCPPETLHRARLLEVVAPLLATFVLAGGVASLILLPISMMGLQVLVYFVGAVVATAFLSVLGLWASRPLVTRAMALA